MPIERDFNMSRVFEQLRYGAKCEEMMCNLALMQGRPIATVMAVCKEVCSHYPDRSIDTLTALYHGFGAQAGKYYRDYLETEKKLEDAQS